jgi:nucleotide-binding universal stress UspA family protein
VKTILLLAHTDNGQASRLQAAIDITRALRGHLICLDVARQTPIPNVFGGITPMLAVVEAERELANRQVLTQRLERENISWDYSEATGQPGPCLAARSGLADLIVVSTGHSASDAEVVEGTVLRCGRPILAVPHQPHRIRLNGHALICWDGSCDACDALRAAVPLLTIASRVTILAVDDGASGLPASEALAYLAHHRIHATLEVRPHMRVSVGATLLSETERLLPDFVVMGAYGHGRLQEAIFGGATRTMLRDSPAPIFLAHATRRTELRASGLSAGGGLIEAR